MTTNQILQILVDRTLQRMLKISSSTGCMHAIITKNECNDHFSTLLNALLNGIQHTHNYIIFIGEYNMELYETFELFKKVFARACEEDIKITLEYIRNCSKFDTLTIESGLKTWINALYNADKIKQLLIHDISYKPTVKYTYTHVETIIKCLKSISLLQIDDEQLKITMNDDRVQECILKLL